MTETTQELLARLAGFTPGPWGAVGQSVYSAHTSGPRAGQNRSSAYVDDPRTDCDELEATARLYAAAPDLHRIATEQAAEIARLRDQVNKIDRDRRLVEAQVDRLLALVNSMDDDYRSLQLAAESLGAMPEGYCFCSKDRIGDDSKTHEPECAELRAALQVQP